MGFHNLFVSSVSFLIVFYANKYEEIDRARVFPEKPEDFLLPQAIEYDFIIVGAGSSGSTVANRLSREFTVLLLEVGGDPIPQTNIPANFALLIREPSIMHHFTSVKQTLNSLDDDGIAKLGQGKFLGGSSAVNGLSYNRGHPKDYDNWANMTGDESWKYENVLKFFKMTEDFHEERNPNGHMGVGGPLTIRKGGKELHQSYRAFVDGAKELGYSEYENSNAPQSEGFGYISETIRFGRRVSIYDAYIKPILDRKTLTISRYSKVSKVDIDESNRAVGVYYTQHGVESYARAKYEVIVSAGAMNTPLVLLRSGIGPEDQLKAAQIPVRSNIPVGQGLQDHPLSYVCAKFDDESKSPLKNFSQKDVNDYLEKGKGPLTLPLGLTAQGFVVSTVGKTEPHPDWPDLFLILFHNHSLFIPNGGEDNKICMEVVLARPFSRGSLSLDTKNVMNPGIWDPNWLENERDVKVIAEGMKITASIFESQAFKSQGISLIKTLSPSCEQEYGTDAFWQCHVRRVTRTCWHPTGSCKMGADDDKSAVVDTKLRVKGIKGLRVIDNSIQPLITNANTNAPAIMIAQKGAYMILKEYERGEHKQTIKNEAQIQNEKETSNGEMESKKNEEPVKK